MAEVVDIKQEHVTWAPVNNTDVISSWQVVQCGNDAAGVGDGVYNITAAAGAADTTGKAVPFGVVLGNNDFSQTLNSGSAIDTGTGSTNITGVVTQATQTAREWFGQEGMFNKGDGQAFVQVALLDATVKVRWPLYNGAWGTAPTVETSTTTSTDGLGFTTAAIDFTPVADYQTFYCRTGANAGHYRISETTSTTVHTFQVPWTYDVAIGDTFVVVPVRFGYTRFQTDALASYIDVSATPATDYYNGVCTYMDLSRPGQEYVDIKFAAEHFNATRA